MLQPSEQKYHGGATMTTETIIKDDNIKGLRIKSFKDRYILMDNIETRSEPIVYTYAEIYNPSYTCMIVVTHGTLHMVVNNKLVEVRSNEVFIITPFVHFEFLESRCIMYCILVRDEIIEDIYEHTATGSSVGIRYYATHHYHLERYYIDILNNDYNLIRIEHERNNYRMKEMALRAFITAFISHLYSFVRSEDEIMHPDNAKGWQFYHKFLNQLSLYYKKERTVQFYANKVGITSKYLSAIIYTYTGHTASQAIDNYVAYRIKQMLYSNNTNIKKISEHYNFPNQSFFGRFFKRVVGLSPYEYQKQNNRRSIA